MPLTLALPCFLAVCPHSPSPHVTHGILPAAVFRWILDLEGSAPIPQASPVLVKFGKKAGGELFTRAASARERCSAVQVGGKRVAQLAAPPEADCGGRVLPLRYRRCSRLGSVSPWVRAWGFFRSFCPGFGSGSLLEFAWTLIAHMSIVEYV